MKKFTITLEADEATMQRFVNLLIFARVPMKDEYEDPPGLPWPLADPGEEQILPPLIDPEKTRAEITRWFEPYINRHGTELARAMLREYGAENASGLKEDQLEPFLADLQRSMPWFK